MELESITEAESATAPPAYSRYEGCLSETTLVDMAGIDGDPIDLTLEGAPYVETSEPRSTERESNQGDPFVHLADTEAEVLKKQVFTSEAPMRIRTLYRYATASDSITMAVSAVCAIAGGAALPLMTVIFGKISGVFESFYEGRIARSELNASLTHNVLYFVYLAVGEFVATYISTVGFIYTGERITGSIREQYLAACLRQNIGFYDKVGAGEMTTHLTADTILIQNGISEKISLTLSAIATFLTAFVIGYIKFWKLTLILTSTVVAIVLVMGLGSKFRLQNNQKSLDAYAMGGSLAEEVISSIRNATAFGTQEKLVMRYNDHLIEAERYGFRVKAALGFMLGGFFFVLYLNYGLAFWQGARFVVDGQTNLESVLTIVLAIMIGAFALGNVAPNIQAFATSVSAAAKIFEVIDRESPLDPTANSGERPESVSDTVGLEFRKVRHIYPSRPDVTALHAIDLVIPAGKQTALVGASGSSKSTIVGLIARFYDPVSGRINFDGHDITKLNLRWLRQHISLVSQEPVLFSTSIRENIRFGLVGTPYESETSEKQDELIHEAAKTANAHDFITRLTDAYDTQVGARGFLLSGGQKQRIAIARAIVGNPKVLLLDEATSALDTKSEDLVQAALEAAAKGRTTIVIAHRLSTVKNSDNIVMMMDGRIIEQGTHDELMQDGGAYSRLVEAQKIARSNETAEDDQKILGLMDEKLENQTMSGRLESANDSDNEAVQKMENLQMELSATNLSSQSYKAYSLWALIRLIASLNKQESFWMVFGLLWSIICGGGNPTQAVFFAKEIVNLAQYPSIHTAQHTLHDSNFWSLMYLMLACVQLIAFLAQGIAFAFCSERLIHRVRCQAFRSMLRQEISFFDREENAAGALTSFLSTRATDIAGLSGATLGTLLTVVTTLVAAISLSVAIGWKLALVTSSTIPAVLACGFFRYWVLFKFEHRASKDYEASANYACEAIGMIRTVASLTREDEIVSHYRALVRTQVARSLRSVYKASTLYAASQSLTFLCMALGFWYGGTLLANGEYDLIQFFICFPAITFGAQAAGTLFSFAPDMGKAQEAARQLKVLFDRRPAIDSWSNDGIEVDADAVRGKIEFRNVHFRYPTRPDQLILRGLSLIIEPGQYVALVGSSGCGKSTIISLLERFYDCSPSGGDGIYLDDANIKSLKLGDYRSSLALVSQEPTLYEGTIRENILLGCDNDNIADSDIEIACKEANIYDFILSLPNGWATMVGSKGSLLSGGQKQRIAIARALLRKPKILLLDEATSALDSESEHVVQAALDKAAKGRTTIAVAHRLSSIQNADRIFVLDQGRILEQGTHTELMRLGASLKNVILLALVFVSSRCDTDRIRLEVNTQALRSAVKGLAGGIGLASEGVNARKKKKNEDRVSPSQRSSFDPRDQSARGHYDRSDYGENDDEEQWELDEAQSELVVERSSRRDSRQDNASIADSFLRHYPSPSYAIESGRLPFPVVLPQRRPKDRSRGFIRAYAPVLQNHGIDQEMFLDFLDSFTRASEASPWLSTINLAAIGGMFLPHGLAIAVSVAVRVASDMAIEMQSRSRTNKFLDKVNDKFFRPRGLYCLVMTWNPESSEMQAPVNLTSTVSSSVDMRGSGTAQHIKHSFRASNGKTYGDMELGEVAPLVFPALDSLASRNDEHAVKKQRKVKRGRAFVEDYMDRRAQAQYVRLLLLHSLCYELRFYFIPSAC
ncbi:MAG: hypothetical protein Q9227_006199 [Pyrenula ochraceoflavens]